MADTFQEIKAALIKEGEIPRLRCFVRRSHQDGRAGPGK